MTERKVNRIPAIRLAGNVSYRTANHLQKRLQDGNGVLEPKQQLRNLVYDGKNILSS